MNGSAFVDSLSRKFRANTDKELAAALGVTAVAVASWRARANMTCRQIAGAIHRAQVNAISGDTLLDEVKRKLGAKTDLALAAQLGMTTVALWKWRGSRRISTRQIANLVAAAKKSSTTDLATSAIRPIVEFFPINKNRSRGGQKFEVLATKIDNIEHPFLSGLRSELESHHGVYVFFDSRGRAIYAGKARRLFLWDEMNNAFNRERAVQKIKRVSHPERRQTYKSSLETARQIVHTPVLLHELAVYVSAYNVRDELIEELESLLVRSFANDLSNVRMERFGQQRRARAANHD
jgi:hypothetical protein